MDSGVVYCLSRNGAQDMARDLHEMGFSTTCYHAGLSAQQRDKAMADFLSGRVNIVCATIAFGMGIDKSNIRWVIHNNLPGNIESYYQEIGRAGRDGMPAEAVLFYNYGDVIMRRNFVNESGQQAINKEKLDRMLAYAEARVCRRRILLSYFSEERDCNCGNCDNCNNPPKQFDGTITAQKALSAVMRTGQRIGLYTAVNILRGTPRADIRREGYDQLPTYGVGADILPEEWTDYINQMIQLGVFEIAYDQGNRLAVTPFGMRILRGQTQLMLSEYTAPERGTKGQKKTKQAAIPVDPIEQLFAQLKSARADLARRENVQPHNIFSDLTLKEMALSQPMDTDTLLSISGVGEKKAVRYGKRFIREIRKFNGLSTATEQGTSLKETLMLFNIGTSPAEIAAIKNVKLPTIYSHFCKLIDEDLITAYHTLISAADYREIAAVLAKSGNDAYEILSPRYPAHIISLAAAITRAVQRKKA